MPKSSDTPVPASSIAEFEHSLDELEQLLIREIPLIKASFAKAHSAGIREEWYASLVEGQLPTYCIESLRDGSYSNLDEMIEAAKQMRERLSFIGVKVRPHGNDNDRVQVESFRNSLSDVIDRDAVRSRSAPAIERDAESMTVV